MISRRAMMNDKIVSQSGNTLLLEKCKGSYFNGLTLHGGSTQGSTTGANLLPCAEEEAVTLLKEYAFENPLPAGEYRVSIKSANREPVGNIFQCVMKYVEGNSVYGKMSSKTKSVIMRPTNAVVSFTIYSDKAYNESNGKTTIFTGLMINAGSATIPYELYTGGKPSPSPSYPQEIESAGQSGEIGVEVGNNGYIQKGTYFLDVRPFSLKKGYTYHIKCEKIIENAINCFVLNEYNKNLSNGAILYDYGYTTKKLTIPNSAGIVDKECMMPMRYDRDYTFTVKAEGLYLYQAVNDPAKNTDEFYVGYAPNILNEEYKKQTIIIPTPGGLPGIPVSSGGNYTDKDGQQWICDEIDLAKGERVKWIEEYRFTGAEAWFSWGVNNITEGITGFYWYYGSVIPTNHREILNTHAVFSINVYGGREEGTMANIASGGDDYLIWSVRNEYLEDVSSKDAAVQSFKKLLGEINAKMLYCLATPIRTPLPPETIAAYKKLHTYSPTTTVINDAGAGMSVGYRKVRG